MKQFSIITLEKMIDEKRKQIQDYNNYIQQNSSLTTKYNRDIQNTKEEIHEIRDIINERLKQFNTTMRKSDYDPTD